MLRTEAERDHQLHVQAALLSPCAPTECDFLPAPDALPTTVPICGEALLAAEALEDVSDSLVACTTEERGYKPRPKKGKPIDKTPVMQQHM